MQKNTMTVYDIAKMAGVSASTVSRVLSGNVKVSPEKEKIVRELVEKYQFVPNALAQNFYHQKTHNVGIIVPDIRNSFYSKLFVECEKALAEQSYNVILSNTMNDLSKELKHLDGMSSQRVDAILQVGGGADEVNENDVYREKINHIHEQTPVIITNSYEGTNCHHLLVDDAGQMRIALNYLYKLGHRKIAVIGGYQHIKPTFRKRQAYIEFMKEHHLIIQDEWIVNADYSANGGREAIEEMLLGRKQPTAVVAMNDSIGFGIIQKAIEMGYRVPEQLSVVSFDNSDFSTLCEPQLTTVDYNYEKFSKGFVEIIESTNQKEQINYHFQGFLVERASCAKI